MKDVIMNSLTQLVANRRLLALVVALVLVSIAAIIYMSVTIQTSDVRVITHYTAYGSTHFYRDSWAYLLSFVAFVGISAGFSISIGFKMLSHERPQLAALVSWFGIAVIGTVAVVYHHLIELL